MRVIGSIVAVLCLAEASIAEEPAAVAVAASPKEDVPALYQWKPEGGKKLGDGKSAPWLRLPGADIRDIPAGSTLTVRMTASSGKTVQVSFGGSFFPDSDSLSLPLVADGAVHEYVFRFPRHVGNTTIQLNPTDAPGQVNIESVVLLGGPECVFGVGSFFMDRVLPRAGRQERVCGLIDNKGKEPGEAVVTLVAPPGVKLLGPADQEVSVGPETVKLVSWQVQADAAAAVTLTLKVSPKNGNPVSTDLPVRFDPPVKEAKFDYVPPPVAPKTDYLVGAMYFPGWKEGLHGKDYGWRRIVASPERKPALGWYDEHNPEVSARALISAQHVA